MRSICSNNDLDLTLKVPGRMPQRLNSVGITAILDAMTAPEGLPVYDALLARPRSDDARKPGALPGS